MRVELAGHNVDTAVLAEAQEKGVDQDVITPEPISAAYARISRFDKPVDELRRIARTEVAKARSSNQRIIWEMGHHSVAEHAVFNFDLIGLSRLAIEAVERFRLCSFTEKSQRYITLDGDFVRPVEIEEAALGTELVALVEQQSALYREVNEAILKRLCEQRPEEASAKGGKNLLEGEAKEDARYVTSLATEGQLGLTVNARNLELMIRRFAAHELAEVRTLGQQVFTAVERVAPSLVLFIDPCPHDQRTYPRLGMLAAELDWPTGQSSDAMPRAAPRQEMDNGSVQLIDATPDADVQLAAALLHTVSGKRYSECYRVARCMTLDVMQRVLSSAMANMELFDSVLREFEHIGCSFELVVSAACFGQLKRHRMMTLTSQPYDPALGLTVPRAVVESGHGPRVTELAQKAEALAGRIAERSPHAAAYALTNGHRRRVHVSVNARELYHISRLREDHHAQWDIRQIAAEMVRQANKAMPLTLMLSGGKDVYSQRYQEVFGRPPQVLEPKLPGG